MPLLFLLSANFIFYIAFVQFGLLKIIEGRFGLSIEALILPLSAMAVTGAISSITVGYIIDRSQSTLRKVFNTACFLSILEGIAAVFSITVFNTGLLIPLFAALGLLMGINGVLVIRAVEAWPGARQGLTAGYAMAVVYLISSLLAGFVPMPERVALICGILAALTGALCLPFSVENPHLSNPPSPRFAKGGNLLSPPLEKGEQGGLSYLKVVIILATLIAVDSFLFHIETNREEIYGYTWEGRWLWNGIVHATAAIVGGVLWDKKGEGTVLKVIVAAFMLSLLILTLFPIGYLTGLISTLFYNTAVSFYGIMLLLIWLSVAPEKGIGFKIGTGMAVCGWIASPLGIGLAIKTASAPVNMLMIGPLAAVVIVFFSSSKKVCTRRTAVKLTP